VKRVVVFVDYQNVYRGARRTFGLDDGPSVEGQVSPLQAGLLLASLREPADRVLAGVRLYRGLPSNKFDPKGYGACMRQLAAWATDPRVLGITRPVNYRDRDQPREKGIDVRLATDLVLMAARDEFDVAVLFSRDTDLLPAIEAVLEIKGGGSCEVAAWTDGVKERGRLRIDGRPLWCHYLNEEHYRSVEDLTDYRRPAPRH
jgi:hypothetical protein